MQGRGVAPTLIGHDEATFTRAVTGTETSGWNGAQMYYQVRRASLRPFVLCGLVDAKGCCGARALTVSLTQIIDAETGGSYKL